MCCAYLGLDIEVFWAQLRSNSLVERNPPNSGAASYTLGNFPLQASPSNELDPPPPASNADPLVTVREASPDQRLRTSDNHPPRRDIELITVEQTNEFEDPLLTWQEDK
ncbi:hypothetical protein C8J57DRAFT_1230465 [Mycena rebaudengoi]|nr:hypothetical protein C8J57DRAFT_1230465 [Mycena rebaudengoi]